ncbi:hypothetical protein BUALT_Bualt03G0163500 [Buddleja alternifolia]|uniref:Uncharacterized protein n=1 Tax=Buddleja alternifolia TaxID=168488 RepID=A0AAV6Y1J7_9LAMI|nr:hypothetical protein BUALT_Bualt03G0163500 [Buddleja alternifolia]
MGRKRKDSGRTMMDDVHETEEATSMHDLPSRDMCQNSTSVCSRKGSGRSKLIKKWNKGPKLQLKLTPDGEIDGPERLEFKTQLGVLARNSYKFPHIYTSFDKMPQHIIDDMWDEIKNTTLTDEAKRDVIKESNAKWEQGKYVKKKNSRPYEDDEEMLKELSQDLVPPEQWEYMKEMRDSISRVPEGEQTREIEETVWTEFMGADSRDLVKCAGQGVRLSKHRRSMCSNDAITKIVREELMQEVNEKMREKDEQMRKEREQMRKEIEEMREEREQRKGYWNN